MTEPQPGPDSKASEGAPRGVMRVRREKKGRRGKTVTRVSGGRLDAAGRAELCGDLKRALGCGAMLEGDAILLQGELTERAARWLRAERGVDCRIEN